MAFGKNVWLHDDLLFFLRKLPNGKAEDAKARRRL
jgi:hypothetical protein